MAKPILALALCRVSTPEQLENNSLNRQEIAVRKAANDLGVTIPDDGWWSGNMSSKRGTNVNRKDLQWVTDYCKRNKRVKYVIVNEPDRFMRSIDEAAYFEVTFRQLGVTVWYASDPELNKGDLASKLLKFTKYLSAEGSNEERQQKSIDGNGAALRAGRYPFSPKPGYKRGYERGIQEVHPVKGPLLKKALIDIAERRLTPTQALIDLNKSEFMKGRSLYKMDKFRTIVTDPFYAGILHIDKQIKVHNENGLHEPLISKAQHLELVGIMDGKKKNQSGPRKNGNPKYPLSNLVNCELCAEDRIGRYVGYDHGNGKNPNLVYEKYRCRACGRYLTRQELHEKIEQQFAKHPITDEGLKQLFVALDTVWKQKEGEAEQETRRIQHKIGSLNDAILAQVEAVTDPTNATIKDEILLAIGKKKAEVDALEDELESLASAADADKEQFLQFAFDFVKNMGSKFLELSPENRLRCKQVVFPAGFYMDADNKVYTPEISPLIRLASNKNAPRQSSEALMVRVRGL